VLALLCLWGNTAMATEVETRDAIHQAVRKLEADWNRGDMEAYLAAYANTSGVALLSSNKPLRSWQQIAEVYRSSFPDPTAMGQFHVKTVEVQVGADESFAIASGTFEHRFPALFVDGAFTLVYARDGAGRWLIVHEHTSRAQ
jgi:ketosteroid isomerase-like protein